MIAPKELFELKQRMLLAAEAAHRLATLEGESMQLEPEEYGLVYGALTSLKTDCRRVLAELDVLRGMFADKVGAFFMEVVNAGDGSDGVGGGTLAGVPPGQGVGSGEASRDDDATPGGRLDRSGTTGEPPRRSKPRRNSRRNRRDKSDVDALTGEGEMDRSTQD